MGEGEGEEPWGLEGALSRIPHSQQELPYAQKRVNRQLDTRKSQLDTHKAC